eukprot:11210337-Lingulodinium_polyedra.AAC.1
MAPRAKARPTGASRAWPRGSKSSEGSWPLTPEEATGTRRDHNGVGGLLGTAQMPLARLNSSRNSPCARKGR